jgi:uncharacterized protein
MKEFQTMRRLLPAIAVAGLLLVPGVAGAHITVQPATAPAGGFARVDLRVPNERDDAGTVKVDLQLPPGVISASYEPIPGWSVKVTRSRAAKPIDVGGGLKSDEQISRITWTGDGRDGIVAPGQFQDFGLSLRLPDGKPGRQVTFKALQTYQGGDVVRWIGPADSDEPAPTVTLTAADGSGGHGAPSGTAAGGQDAAPAATTAAPATGDGGTDGLAIAGVALGALGLLAGSAALVTARRRPAPAREIREEVPA